MNKYRKKHVNLSKNWENIRKKVLERDNFECQICGSREHLTVHHIKPRSKGGTNRMSNLITLCTFCHDEVEIAGYKNKAAILGHEPQWKQPQFIVYGFDYYEGATIEDVKKYQQAISAMQSQGIYKMRTSVSCYDDLYEAEIRTSDPEIIRLLIAEYKPDSFSQYRFTWTVPQSVAKELGFNCPEN